MIQTIASLRNKIDVAADLQSVVRTMKAMAASNIGQYEKSLTALTDCYHTIELGLGVCFRETVPYSRNRALEHDTESLLTNVIVYGSDQGLVGQFNEVIAEYATKRINELAGQVRVWSVGERLHARLCARGQKIEENFSLPTSINSITALTGEILLATNSSEDTSQNFGLHLFYNQQKTGASYGPTDQVLLPLNSHWVSRLANQPWPGFQLPQLTGAADATLAALIREYLFVSLFRASTQSLASENMSRLTAMQRADKNIEELLKDLKGTFHQIRQKGIDEELFDVISGFEALSRKSIRGEEE